jgi:phosphate transport system substrate-binding protein
VRRALLQLSPVIVVAALVGIAASEGGGSGEGRARKRDRLTGAVRIDGAAAMRNRVDAAAQSFQRRHPDVRVTVGASGDQSAIALFCAGEVDIAAVARRLDRAERRACRSSGIRYGSVQVAREDIAVVVSERNPFVNALSLVQLRTVWRPTASPTSWADVDPRLPAAQLEPVGWKPDSASATLLAEALFGPVDPLVRDDYVVAADAKELTRLVASSANAIGYLPQTQLRPESGVRTVSLLPRPLYLDVNLDSLRNPEVRRFIRELPAFTSPSPDLHPTVTTFPR